MRCSSLFRSAVVCALSAGLLASAQTFAASTGTAPVLGGTLPPPSALPPHHHKTDAPLIYARVRDGVFTVDGMVGKVQLNYDVKGANFLYLFVPGVGTALVTLAPTDDALWTISTYENEELVMQTGAHTLRLSGVESLVNDKGKQPEHLYVRLDRNSWRLNRTPMMGFGAKNAAPYEWPGALANQPAAAEPAQTTLPVPASLLPRRASYEVPTANLR